MENTKIEIIEYEDKYKEQVITLVSECLFDQGVRTASCLPVDDDDLQHIPQIYSGRGKFWVAVEEGKVVGSIGVQERGETLAKLKRLFVLPHYRGTGLGQRLLDTALQFVKEAGYTKMTLNTHINMKRAHSFYKKNNFIHVGMWKDHMYTFEREI